ncbi:MAG: hypothetical protein V8T86_17730, partial [Victivallis sp.]
MDGSIDLSLTGEFDYIVFGGGLGTGAGVTGDITLTVTGKSGARNGMIDAGGNGDVGIESRREGTRITVTVNSTSTAKPTTSSLARAPTRPRPEIRRFTGTSTSTTSPTASPTAPPKPAASTAAAGGPASPATPSSPARPC